MVYGTLLLNRFHVTRETRHLRYTLTLRKTTAQVDATSVTAVNLSTGIPPPGRSCFTYLFPLLLTKRKYPNVIPKIRLWITNCFGACYMETVTALACGLQYTLHSAITKFPTVKSRLQTVHLTQRR